MLWDAQGWYDKALLRSAIRLCVSLEILKEDRGFGTACHLHLISIVLRLLCISLLTTRLWGAALLFVGPSRSTSLAALTGSLILFYSALVINMYIVCYCLYFWHSIATHLLSWVSFWEQMSKAFNRSLACCAVLGLTWIHGAYINYVSCFSGPWLCIHIISKWRCPQRIGMLNLQYVMYPLFSF